MKLSQGANISTSTYSETTDLRYQKAVKQISKLININSGLRRDIESLRETVDQLHAQNQKLQQESDEITRDRSFFQQRMQALQQQNSILRAKNQQLFEQSRNVPEFTNTPSHVLEEHQQAISGYESKLEELRYKLEEQGHTIFELQHVVGRRQKQNLELHAELDMIKEQNQLIRQQKDQKQQQRAADNKKRPQSTEGFSNGNSLNISKPYKYQDEEHDCSKCVQALRQMKLIKEWSTKIDEENVNLNKKLIQIQNAQRSQQPLHYDNSTSSYQWNRLKENIRQLTVSKKKLALKYQKTKSKLQNQVWGLREQDKKLKTKLEWAMRLIGKQQDYIENELYARAMEKQQMQKVLEAQTGY